MEYEIINLTNSFFTLSYNKALLDMNSAQKDAFHKYNNNDKEVEFNKEIILINLQKKILRKENTNIGDLGLKQLVKSIHTLNKVYQLDINILGTYGDKNEDIYTDNFFIWLNQEIENYNEEDFDILKIKYEELLGSSKKIKENQFIIKEDKTKNKKNIENKFNFNDDLKYLIVSFNMSRDLFNDYPNVDIWDDDRKSSQLKIKIKKYDAVICDSENTSHTYYNIIKENARKLYLISSVNELKDKLDNNQKIKGDLL